jgi:hypothetical protein
MNYRTFKIRRAGPGLWTVADPNTCEVLWNGPTRAAAKHYVDLVMAEMGRSLLTAMRRETA